MNFSQSAIKVKFFTTSYFVINLYWLALSAPDKIHIA